MEVWLFRLLVVAAAALFARQMLARYRLIARAPGGFDTSRPRRRASPPSSARSSSRAAPSGPGRSSASRTCSCSGASARSPATRLVEALRGLGVVDLTGTAAFHAYKLALVPFSVAVLVGIVLLAIRRGILRPRALGAYVSKESLLISAFIAIADGHVPGRRVPTRTRARGGRRAARARQLVGAHAGHPGLHGADPGLEAPAPAAVAGDGVPARADPRHGAASSISRRRRSASRRWGSSRRSRCSTPSPASSAAAARRTARPSRPARCSTRRS